ncbi:MAG TPA: hypothetical protein VHH11_10170 [Gammaproteobacteria bacterium]|nr:hypothetical protein [Gammaproteobacteria bacterium]
MQRRDLMTMTGAALLFAGGRALAQSGTATATDAKVVRIHSTADGGSRVEELTISPNAKPIPVTRMTAGAYRGSGTRAPDWHNAPRKQFAINMTGFLEVELTDGTRRKIGSDLVFLEDTTGKGHVTRPLGPITNVFIHVPDDFDIVAWAAGK